MSNMIIKALMEYGSKIKKSRPNDVSVGTYRVTKPWGHEIWLEINEAYALKIIHMREGERSSLQSHKMKYETNYVISGAAEVLIENSNGELESFVFRAGDGWNVPVGKKHRVIAKTTYTAIEASSPYLDDVIRHEDDSGRLNGKVENEHK